MANLNAQQIYTLILNLFRKRKWHILLCMVGVMAPVMLYNETTEPVYEAGVSIIFEDISNPLTSYEVDPMRRYYRETSLLNRIEEIKSRSLAEDIAAVLPKNLIERFPFPEDKDSTFNKDKFVVDKIKNSLSASVIKMTDVIRINVESSDRILAASLANLAAEVLRDRNFRQKQREVGGVRKVIEEQLAIYEEQLGLVEQELKDFKEANNITSLQRESEEILRRITDCEVMYNQVRAERKATEEKLIKIQQQLREKLLPTLTNVSSPLVLTLKKRLVELNNQYTKYEVEAYSLDRPQMVQLKNEIEQVKKSLSNEVLKLSDIDFITDPFNQMNNYVTQSLSLEVELEALKAREQACVSIIKEYGNTLKSLPAKELKLANLMRKKDVNEKTYLMLYERREEARISEAERSDNLRIIDTARRPERPIRPNKRVNLAMGLVMGFLVGFGLAFFLESMHNTLKTGEEIEKLTTWPVLASIPQIEASKNGSSNLPELPFQLPADPYARRGMHSYIEPNSMVSEAFRVLRTNLQFLNDTENIKTILISSISAQEGKSTTTTNLAITLTKLGLKVLVIDADLRRPAIHKLLETEKEPGLGDILTNHNTIINDLSFEDREKNFYDKVDNLPMWSSIQNLKGHKGDVSELEERFQDFYVDSTNNEPKSQYINFLNVSLIESIQSTKIKNLRVLSSGKFLQNPSEIVSTNSMNWLLEVAKKKYDIVLIDSPPLLLVPDSMILSSIVDGILLVVEADKNEQNMLLKVKQFLDKRKSKVVGVVLNRVDLKTLYSDKDYYYFG